MHSLFLFLCFATAALPVGASVQFDFTDPAQSSQWQPAHDIVGAEATDQGLALQITGIDPFLVGPPRDYPPDQPLWLSIELRSEQGGAGQIFFFQNNATEDASLRFHVPPQRWHRLTLKCPPLGPGYRLRLDPPGDGGTTTVKTILVEKRIVLSEPQWLKPAAVEIPDGSPVVRSGEMLLRHAPGQFGAFRVSVSGREMAIGHNRPLVGYILDSKERWMDLGAKARVSARQDGGAVEVTATATDEDGAVWIFRQRFSPLPATGEGQCAIDAQCSVSVSQPRQVIYLPLLTLLPGAGGFGAGKTQALFPGLEYLDKDEPSSSEADLVGPQSKRQVPDSLKITIPLMSLLADGRYIGITWREQDSVAAVFDSPDRIFAAGGHLMGLIYPGASGADHDNGSLMPQAPQLLPAGQTVSLSATLIGGQAANLTVAVRQYVALRGLPELPSPGMDLQGYLGLASGGWLKSACRVEHRFRHAFPGTFNPQPAADAAIWMKWIAQRTSDKALAGQLQAEAPAALAEVNPAHRRTSGVGHIRGPAAALIYGSAADLLAAAAEARQGALGMLGRFEPDGSLLYRPSNGNDLGKTHFAPDANGLTCQVVATALEWASFSGDTNLVARVLTKLDALGKFANTVPRGAQTWECPLHTPDILASAHLVRAYTLGYQITGRAEYLEQARYWAWTGVPFVYLVNPAGKPVGPYATIAVLGATQWVAPNWMGLPVQWCGLVYADALYQFAPLDPGGPWRQLADGITISGIQQTFRASQDPARQGLLPDSFSLRDGVRNNPAINPATVQACAARYFRQPPLYSFRALADRGILLHAPGELSNVRADGSSVSFTVSGCVEDRYMVLVAGLTSAATATVNGRPLEPEKFTRDPRTGLAVFELVGPANVQVRLP